MISHAPPYGLAPRSFAFAQLAGLTGRLPLGETRETVLACLLGARLVAAMVPPVCLAPEQRRARADAAAAWLAALALPDDVRPPLARLLEASADSVAAARAALLDVLQQVPALDEPARAELEALAGRLARGDG